MAKFPTALLIFDGFFHPPWLGRRHLESHFKRIAGWSFRRIPSLEGILQLSLTSFQCLALYFHHKRVSPSTLECLDRYVRTGGGILAIHCASASFKDQPRYFEILGGRFRGHGPVENFRVDPTKRDDIFAGIPGFYVRDECFRHDYDPSIQIHFSTTIDGEVEPVVWTRMHGEGRVCYCSLGHTVHAMYHPQVLEILKRGLLWTAGESHIEG
jgi:type 1 glutamine amidotransferase